MSVEYGSADREPERVVATLRPHGRALFWPSLVLIAAGGATGFLFGRFDDEVQNLAVLGAGLAVVLLLWVLPLLRWLSKRVVVTTRRIVLRKGVLVRSRQEVLHSRGYGIVTRRNALQALMRSGDILIDTGVGRPVILRDLPRVELVQRALHDLMEKNVNVVAARQQSGQPQYGQPQYGQPQSGQYGGPGTGESR